MNETQKLLRSKRGALYTFAVIFVTLFLMGFIWFALYQGISQIREVITQTMMEYSEESTTYPTFELADTFLANLWWYFPLIVLFGLILWVYVYSQKRIQKREF